MQFNLDSQCLIVYYITSVKSMFEFGSLNQLSGTYF